MVRTRSLLALIGATALSPMALAIALGACGGGDKQPPVTPSAAPTNTTDTVASSSPSASAAPAATASASAPPPAPTSTVATTKTDPNWASCHQKFQGAGRDYVKTAKGKDVSKEVALMADGCKGYAFTGRTPGKEAEFEQEDGKAGRISY